MFVYELSGCEFESSCSHLNFRFCNCFEQGVPSHSGNYRMWIHSEMCTWHDKNIRSMMVLFLRKNHLLRCWGWFSLLNWIGALTLTLLLKLPPRKLEPWCVLWSFFLLRLLCISINLLYGHAWNTVVMSGLVLLVATWNCWISYKNGYAGLLVLQFHPILNHWLIAEM